MIFHYNGIHIRAKGSGNLRVRLLSQDEIYEQALVPLVMTLTSNRTAVRLANFNEESASLEIKTTEMDEIFIISRITVFIKPIASSWPG